MTPKTKLTIVAGVIALGLLAIPVARRLGPDAAPSNARKVANLGTSPAKDEGNHSRALPSVTWKLPFRLKPRLTPEQATILAGGKAGSYLREHPEQDDLLVAWAAADPDAASAWLASVGNVEVDDVGYYFSHLSALAAGVFAHGGFEELHALLEKHANDPLLPPKFQDGGFASHPWFKMAREDTGQEAIAYLQAHPEETELAGTFLSGIDETDRMLAALDYFQAKGIDCSPDYWQLGSRAEKDGALLADWAAASRPELLGDILLGWNSNRPQEVKKWLDTHAARPALAPVLGEVRKVIDEPVK
jgi:hypothetical protein